MCFPPPALEGTAPWRLIPHCPVSGNMEEHRHYGQDSISLRPGPCPRVRDERVTCKEGSQRAPRGPEPSCLSLCPDTARPSPLTCAVCFLPLKRYPEEVQPFHPWVLYRHTGGHSRPECSSERCQGPVSRWGPGQGIEDKAEPSRGKREEEGMVLWVPGP